jgi:hypothetical protein
MKLGRAVCFLLLFGISAAAAYAQTPVDPIILVQKMDPASCGGAGQPMCYPGSPVPLVETYSSTLSLAFLYDPSNPMSKLTTLELELIDVPDSVLFTCETNIYTTCAQGAGSGTPPAGDYNVLFILTGAGHCLQDGGAGGTCPGFLASGDGFSITEEPLILATPEPASIILFGSGLLLFAGVLRRRWMPN